MPEDRELDCINSSEKDDMSTIPPDPPSSNACVRILTWPLRWVGSKF